MIRLSVGSKSCLVHTRLLCHYSTYYQAALLGSFDNKLPLATIDGISSETFDSFVRWLYRGVVEYDDSQSHAEDARVDNLLALYVFADRFDFPALRDEIIIDLHIQIVNDDKYLPSPAQVNFIFEHLPPSAGLCKLVVEFYATRVTILTNTVEHWECYSKHFITAVMCVRGDALQDMLKDTDSSFTLDLGRYLESDDE